MKIAFTVGKFDCLNYRHIHLVKEMRKYVFPNGKISVLILDDYPIFLREKAFPLQRMEHRHHNLKYICGADCVSVLQEFAIREIEYLHNEAKRKGDHLVMVAYREDEKCAEVIYALKNKIQVRFIKPPKYAE